MKPDSTSMTTTNFVASSLGSLDLSTKFMGMIELSPYKMIRNQLFLLFDYIESVTVPRFGLHSFISLWRIIQFLGPALCAGFFSVWGKNTLMSSTMDVTSVLYHIIPVSYRQYIDIYFCFSFSAIFFIVYGFVVISGWNYHKEAKLPKYVPSFLSFFFGSFGYILPPIAAQFISEMIGRMIQNPAQNYNTMNVMAIIVASITILVFIWFFVSIYSISLTFRPDSLMAAVPTSQINIMILTLIITILLGIASYMTLYIRLSLIIISIALYLLSFSLLTKNGGFISLKHERWIKSCSMTGVFSLSLICFHEFMVLRGTELFIVVLSGFFAVSIMINNALMNKRRNNNMMILDRIDENTDGIDSFSSINDFCRVLLDGFSNAHPVCISWTILKAAIEKWTNSTILWVIYAKFLAIYPEETIQLEWISNGMAKNKLKGSLSKHIRFQIVAILRQRETNLIPELKSKLDKISKQTQATKHKVRYIWDLIIQGNIRELESAIQRANDACESCEADFQHLIRQFPNSRFVARAYGRFLRDVVADHAGHRIWAHNVSLLQRGIPVISDQAHSFGLRAFPLLPKVLHKNNPRIQAQPAITDDTLTQDIETDDDQSAIDAELRMNVRNSINKLEISSYSNSRCVRVLILFLLFFVPVVFMCFYIPYFITDISTPLEFMNHISSIRTGIFQTLGVLHHLLMETFGLFNSPQLFAESASIGFGNTSSTRDQLVFLTQGLTTNARTLSEIMSFHADNVYMNQVRSLLFHDSINFTYKTDKSNEEYYSLVSGQSAIMDFIVNIQSLLKASSLTNETLYKKEIHILYHNIDGLSDDLSKALSYAREYINHSEGAVEQIMIYIIYSASLFIFIINLLVCTWINKTISRDKMMIYKCIASLPKNVVSRVADGFKVLKAQEDEELKTSHTHDDELNKQEENMLKIFATSADHSGSKTTDTITIIIDCLFITILHIGCVILLCYYVQTIGRQLRDAAPHVDYIMAAYAYDFASIMMLNLLIGDSDGYHIPGYDFDHLSDFVLQWQAKGIIYYHTMLFGDISLDAVPFSSLDHSLSLDTSIHNCDNIITSPNSTHEVYECWDPDLLATFVQLETRAILHMITHTNVSVMGNDTRLDHLWHIHQKHLYDYYYLPLFTNIVPSVKQMMKNNMNTNIILAVFLFVMGLIVEVSLIIALTESEQRQKFALRLLLHCPGNIVLSNPHISRILSGNFTDRHVDQTTRDAEFYDSLVEGMPDAVITSDINGTIISVNAATHRICGVSNSQLIGSKLSDFGQKFKDSNPFDLFNDRQITSTVDFEKKLLFIRPDGGEIFADTILAVLGETIMVSIRDESQTATFNKLIADEKNKSDQLLASILPAKLVSRVQLGEKNISFAVQSATIVFIDIVSFTPWCGSLPANQVMSTLNLLFKEFDQLVANHPTMTKIKCIGDCYMAAGGIFSEVNQPSLHAKDCVEFGLEAIEAIGRINQKIGQNLMIRVGINTGGPIVAGVLGTEKPTFEIIGSAIVMAQQMEHHGVPMNVHISRSVYELIYGGSFDVKERGDVHIKNGSVVTYLIKCKK